MAKTYEKVGKGALFTEDTDGNEKKPSLKGNVEIGGRKFAVAGWPRVSKAGQRYISLQFTDTEDTRQVFGDGALFQRDSTNHKAPKFTGPAEIAGKEFALSVWQQKSKAGLEYLSIKVELVTETEEAE